MSRKRVQMAKKTKERTPMEERTKGYKLKDALVSDTTIQIKSFTSASNSF